MTIQPWLFPRPRLLDRGEGHRCLDCGRHDPQGAYGPQRPHYVTLTDGSEYLTSLHLLWGCRPCSLRWWTGPGVEVVERRRRRLAVFRAVELEGLRGMALWVEAERRLRCE